MKRLKGVSQNYHRSKQLASDTAASRETQGSSKMDNPATSFLAPEKRVTYPCRIF